MRRLLEPPFVALSRRGAVNSWIFKESQTSLDVDRTAPPFSPSSTTPGPSVQTLSWCVGARNTGFCRPAASRSQPRACLSQ